MLVATIHSVVSTYGIKSKDVANATPTKSAGESTAALKPAGKGAGTEYDNCGGRQQDRVYSPRQN